MNKILVRYLGTFKIQARKIYSISDSQLLPRVAVIERNLNRNRNETTKSYVCCLNIPIDFHASSVRSNLLLDTISLWDSGGRLVRLC